MKKPAILILIIAILVNFFVFRRRWTNKNYDLNLENAKVLNNDKLFNEKGFLSETGYSFSLTKKYDLKNAAPVLFSSDANKLRFTKFDTYTIFTQNDIFLLLVKRSGYKNEILMTKFNFGSNKVEKLQKGMYSRKVIDNEIICPDNHILGNYNHYFSLEDFTFISRSISDLRKIALKKDSHFLELDLNIQKFSMVCEVIPFNFEHSKWLYSEKYFDMKGKLTYKNEQENIEKINAQVLFEANRGFLSYHTDYRKVVGMKAQDLNSISFIFQEGLTDNIDKSSIGDFLFVNGEGTALHPVKFKFDKLNWNNSMKFSTEDQEKLDNKEACTVNLIFATLGSVNDAYDFKLFAKDVTYVFGVFNGYVIDKNGIEHQITETPGVFESVYLRL